MSRNDYNKYRINVTLEKYDYERIKKYVGEDKKFSNAPAFARHAILRFLEYLETRKTVYSDEDK
jgi:Arc/MetJ-type ribon-helix-helix transcriptional regulator